MTALENANKPQCSANLLSFAKEIHYRKVGVSFVFKLKRNYLLLYSLKVNFLSFQFYFNYFNGTSKLIRNDWIEAGKII